MKKFEDLIDDLGGFSRFQFLIVFGVFSMKFMVGFSMLQMAFLGFVPDFHCIVNGGTPHLSTLGHSHTSRKSVLATTSSSSMGNDTLNKCQINHTDCKNYVFEGPAHTIISEWHLVCDLLWVKATTTSVQMAGVLVGALLSGQLGDHIGRKKTLYGFFLLHALFNLGAAFSTSWPMYMALRCFIGVGIGAILVLILPYPMEFLPLRWRSTLPLIPMFPLGAGTFGLVAWILKDWSKIHIACAILSIPNLCGWFIIPESFRWLTVKGRVKDAYLVVEAIGKINKRGVPLYALDLIKTIAKEEKRWGSEGKKYSYIDIFRGKHMARCTVVFSLMWCFMSMAFYGPSFAVSSFGGSVYLNIVLINVLDIPIMLLTFFINKCVGRRLAQSSLLFVSFLALLSCLVVIWTYGGSAGKSVNLYLSLTAKVFISGAWSVSQAWVTEVYPTVIRNLGYGMANMAARIGGIIAPFAINLDEYATLSYILTCSATFLCLLLTMFVPDTKNMVLADSLVVEVEDQGKKSDRADLKTSHQEGQPLLDEVDNGRSNEHAKLLNNLSN